ncbi:MAG: NAD(P)-dependent oxidoreductase, partial [Gemmatimonadaceae bacterium]
MSRDQVARVLILGASGQVGHALQQSTPPATTLFTPSSSEVDLRTTDSLRAAIRDCAPDVILNCAAFTRVDDAQSHSDTARAINAEAPQIIVEEAVRFGARLIHISTDYVFDGTGSPPNAPGAPTAPLNVYGSTKLAGENAILSANANAVVLRTSWVHSGSGANFVATAVRALTKGGAMHVVDDQVSTP